MRILILGASGRTGQWVLHEALQRGYKVHIIVRSTYNIEENEKLKIFIGSPIDKGLLSEAIENCDIILSLLNISRTTDFPWSPLRTPKTFLSDVMDQVLHFSKKYKIKRIIICSAWGVGDSHAEIPFWFRWMIKYSNIGFAYRDHQRQEKSLRRSNLNWTILRPVGLVNSKKKYDIKISHKNNPKPNLIIARRTLAAFMIKILEDQSSFRKTLTISRDY